MKQYSIATIGSHSALQILKGAQEEGFKTICVCIKGKEEPYKHFGVADELILIDRYQDFFMHEQKLIAQNAVLIPHASMIAYLGIDAIESINMNYFGDKEILRIEADRHKQKAWLKDAGIRVPQTFAAPDDIDRPCIIKFDGADGGAGYFLVKSADEFNQKIKTAPDKKFTIQEYVVGVPVYIHYFYSPLTDELELIGFDRRYESNVDAIGRIPFKDQQGFDVNASYTVVGNFPIVLRESLLPEVFKMGRAVVEQSKKLTGQGLYGAFCLEAVLTNDMKFYTFEISARIVAGTNVHMDGSPYTYLKYGTQMSTGRRIALEIKRAIAQDNLDKVIAWPKHTQTSSKAMTLHT